MGHQRGEVLVDQRPLGKPRHRARADRARRPQRQTLDLLHRADGCQGCLLPGDAGQEGVGAILHRLDHVRERRGATRGNPWRRERRLQGDGHDAQRRPLVHRGTGAEFARVRTRQVPRLRGRTNPIRREADRSLPTGAGRHRRHGHRTRARPDLADALLQAVRSRQTVARIRRQAQGRLQPFSE